MEWVLGKEWSGCGPNFHALTCMLECMCICGWYVSRVGWIGIFILMCERGVLTCMLECMCICGWYVSRVGWIVIFILMCEMGVMVISTVLWWEPASSTHSFQLQHSHALKGHTAFP